MASTYSDALRIELITNGEQSTTWGTTTNTNLGTLIEDAIAGYVNVTHTDAANYTLTTANGSVDEARNMLLNISGALTGARNVVCPTKNKLYVIKNSTTGGFAITIKTSGGTGISVANGEVAIVYCDGTNVLTASSDATADAAAAALAAHIADTSDAHDASAISYAGGTGMSATDVEAAIDELATEKLNLSGGTMTGALTLVDEAYDATTWNGNSTAASKNAIRNALVSLFIGNLFLWPHASTPTYGLLCNGAAVSRTTYAGLFAAIGTTWGAGDGSTTFNIPNISSGYTLAQASSNEGTSTTGEVKAHTHSALSQVTNGSADGAAGLHAQAGGTTGSTGGSANLAAAGYVRICIRF